MKVFISGRITDDSSYKKKFDYAAASIERKIGNSVILNPATLPAGLTEKDYMRICIAMLEAADVAVFLPSWELSSGSKAERAMAEKLGIVCVELTEMEKWSDV